MTQAGLRQQVEDPFPGAAQPSLIRAQQKDELYLQYLMDACHDAVRRLLGPHRALRWASETRALAELLYHALTTGSGRQTPGEEYCDLLQVAGPPGSAALPGPARRGLLVLVQALGPYLAERLAAPPDDEFAAWQRAQAAARAAAACQQQQQDGQHAASRAVLLGQRLAAVAARLRAAAARAAEPAMRHAPAAAAWLREHGGTLLRIHLALFYVYGTYFQPSKRLAGVRFLFLGRSLEGRPSYRFLGVLLLGQLGVSGALWLLRRRGGWPALLPASERPEGSPTHAVLLDADGKLAGPAASAAEAGGGRAGGGQAGDVPGWRKCPLCLSARAVPTATPCGHVFCWQCITEWCVQKPECPLCRADLAPPSLVCVRHADF